MRVKSSKRNESGCVNDRVLRFSVLSRFWGPAGVREYVRRRSIYTLRLAK